MSVWARSSRCSRSDIAGAAVPIAKQGEMDAIGVSIGSSVSSACALVNMPDIQKLFEAAVN
jgi:hypothetical protein